MRTRTSPSAPAAGRLSDNHTALNAALVGALVLLLGVFGAQFFFKQRADKAFAGRRRAQELRVEIAAARKDIMELSRGLRGYLISGKDGWLDPSRMAKIDVTERLRRIRTLTIDDPTQHQRLEVVAGNLSNWLDRSEQLLQLARSDGLEAARQVIAAFTESGREFTSGMEAALDEMDHAEAQLYALRDTTATANANVEIRATQVGTLLAVMLFAWSGVALNRSIRRLRMASTEADKAEEALLDVNQRLAREMAETRKAEVALRQTIDAAPNGMVQVDAKGRIVLVNARMRRLFGYSGEEMLGLTIEALLPERFRKGHLDLREDVTRNPQGRAMGSGRDLFGLRKDGSEFPVEIGLTPIETPEGPCVLATVLDITGRKQGEDLLRTRNAELHAATEQAQAANRTKSEFLANMSHELRTPLNSILILGQELAANASANLTARQVDFARNIHSAGTDLLHLINDILDHSKIESGTVTVEAEEIPFTAVRDALDRTFHQAAETKHLSFRMIFDPALPEVLTTDPKRLQQILKNLLSNAFKFTTQGEVVLHVRPVTEGWTPGHRVLSDAPTVLALTVSDTGIGVAPDKLHMVFEAFQQADSGIGRKYGGTGLGLAISRQLTTLLGGEIRLVSVVGEGSSFTLYLPLVFAGSAAPMVAPATESSPGAVAPAVMPVAVEDAVADDREAIQPGDAAMLIVEDDRHQAQILLGLARARGFKGIVSRRGQTTLALARQYRPAAICLNVFLPDMLGWTVLDQLKRDPVTRQIPVQVITEEEGRTYGLARGAFAYLVKPVTTEALAGSLDRLARFVTRRVKRLLVVAPNAIEREVIVKLLGHTDIAITAVDFSAAALAALRAQSFDCAVLDLRLGGTSVFDLLEAVQAEPGLRDLPVVALTSQDLSAQDTSHLDTLTRSVVLKDVQSPERLFDETALFLHRVVADLPEPKRQMLARLYDSDEALRGAKVLVVDDDARNIFALTTVLENQEMEVLTSTSGRQAIQIVRATPDLRVVIMDVMMPEMDGYQTMQEIRKDPRFQRLPILAVTAKAMRGDRQKCLNAGASDYIAKPVNTDQLLALLRVWLHR